MDVFIDTNIFISFLTKSEKSEEAKKLLENLISKGYSLTTSITVIEETLYILTREILEEKGITSVYSAKKYISNGGYTDIEKELSKFISMLNELDIRILDVKVEITLLVEVMYQFNLLPNDALIAATCKFYGIQDIATFDNDFKRVDFLKVWGL